MTDTMMGVVLPGNRQLEYREFPVPQPGHGQVLVQMKASALCGSDLRCIYRPTDQGEGPEAYQGVIAGHEPCGQVVEVGPGVTRFKPGDRVIVYHICGCGLCHDCRNGWMISCTSPARAAYGWQRDGGHAPYILTEERTLVDLPEPLTYLDGAMVACGFGTSYEACTRINVSGCDTTLITGLGPVGLGTIMLAKAMGARVIGVETVPERIELAKQAGCDTVFTPDVALEGIMEATNGKGVETAIDCSGNGQARALCLEAACQWGRVAYVGEGGSVTFEPSPLLIHKQIALHGSWVCGLVQMEELVERLVRWGMHPQDIVSNTFPLQQTKEAYELFDGGKSGKVAVVFE